jgi:hypothetical protein
MSPSNYRDDIIPQDTAVDDSSLDTGTALPVTEDAIDDLLYGEGRSTEERLRLLRALRGDMAERQGGDLADDDPGELVQMIEDRIAELEGRGDNEGAVLDTDPLAHRETLAPDSDELDELKDGDEASLEGDDEGDPANDDDIAG